MYAIHIHVCYGFPNNFCNMSTDEWTLNMSAGDDIPETKTYNNQG